MDTVIALRRPEDYSPEQCARFEIHFEKLRNRADGAGAIPFEAILEAFTSDERDGIRWCSRDLVAPPPQEGGSPVYRWTYGSRSGGNPSRQQE